MVGSCCDDLEPQTEPALLIQASSLLAALPSLRPGKPEAASWSPTVLQFDMLLHSPLGQDDLGVTTEIAGSKHHALLRMLRIGCERALLLAHVQGWLSVDVGASLYQTLLVEATGHTVMPSHGKLSPFTILLSRGYTVVR